MVPGLEAPILDPVTSSSAADASAPLPGEPVDAADLPKPRRRSFLRPIPVTAFLAVVIAVPYIVYQRAGTVATVDHIDYWQRYSGGFLGIGFTDDQPGLIILSTVDKEKVEVDPRISHNGLAGTFSVVGIDTGEDGWRRRLRGPEVVMIDEEGAIDSVPVSWTLQDFLDISKAADCAEIEPGSLQRCGEPFHDLVELFADWPKDRVPDQVLRFLVDPTGTLLK